MSENKLAGSAILMIILVVAIIGGWEIHLRWKGIGIAYDDNGAMWSDKRAKVYEPSDKADVFIGSSRIKYDLDIDTWKKVTGRDAIQLSVEGNSPLVCLEDLGNDPKFKGKLIVDVTEALYFSDLPAYSNTPRSYIDYYRNQTPAQRASFLIDRKVESRFVFLDQRFLSLNALLDNLEVKNRPGFVSTDIRFPIEFWRQDESRQTKMAPRFLIDSALKAKVTDVWSFFLDAARKIPPPKVDPLPGILQKSKEAVDKIRARGGEVIFLRTPSSGKFWTIEQQAFPRAKFWDRLLAVTHCRGYFFTDYPGMAKYVPVEWSHLGPRDAIGFTRELIEILPPSFTANN